MVTMGQACVDECRSIDSISAHICDYMQWNMLLLLSLPLLVFLNENMVSVAVWVKWTPVLWWGVVGCEVGGIKIYIEKSLKLHCNVSF